MSRLSAIASRAARAFSLRTIVVGVICLSIGGGVAKATPPIDIFQLADGTNTTQLAKVDAAGNLAVSVSNLPATQTVAGTVAVSNFPATQQIAGNVGDARVTSLIALDELTLDAAGGFVSNPHSTAGYTQARVTVVGNLVSCATPLTVVVYTTAFRTPTSFYSMELGKGTTCFASNYNAVFDVPATNLYFLVSGGEVNAGHLVVIAIWAR